MFVIAPDGARLDSSGAFGDEVMGDFGDQGVIDFRQPEDRLARQGEFQGNSRDALLFTAPN